MSTIVTRAGKGSPLTHTEVDNNFTNLNTDKYQSGNTIIASAGTVSAPALSTTGDTNTGIFFPAADTIAFAEGGVESMRIDSNGRLGIGTTAPSSILDLYSASAGGVRVTIQDSGTGTTSSDGTIFGVDSSADFYLFNREAKAIYFGTNNTERMRITSGGDVAVGTTSSFGKMQINISDTSTTILNTTNLYLSNSGAATTNQRVDLAFRWQDGTYNGNSAISVIRESGTARLASIAFSPSNSSGDPTERMRIDSSGNIKFAWNNNSFAGFFFDSTYYQGMTNGATSRELYIDNRSNDTRADIVFRTGLNTTVAERMRITSGGIVLAGTSTAPAGNSVQMVLSNANGGGIQLNNSTSSAGGVINATGGSGLVFFSYTGAIGSESYTERMRITSGGNVGIGTTSPNDKLEVFGSSGAYINVNCDNAGTAGSPIVLGLRFRGFASRRLGQITMQDQSGSQSASGPMIFSTNADLAADTLTERMRITSGGYLKASNSGSYNDAAGSFHEFRQTADSTGLLVEATNASLASNVFLVQTSRNTTNNTYYAINYYNSGAAAFRFRVADSGNVTNTNGSYGTISDAKLKENIVDVSPKLNKVNQLKVRNFNLIGDELKQIGFVAQEFEQVFPSMVEESADKDVDGNDLGTTTKTIKTTVLIPILVKAMQEQQAQIDELKAEIALLKSK